MTAVARRMTPRIYLYLAVWIVSTGILALIWSGWSHPSPSSQAADTLQLVRFYPPEGDQQPYRFSRATSQLLITTIPATPAKLTLRVHSPLPLPPRLLMIAADQRPLAQLMIGEQARVVAVLLPRNAQPPSRRAAVRPQNQKRGRSRRAAQTWAGVQHDHGRRSYPIRCFIPASAPRNADRTGRWSHMLRHYFTRAHEHAPQRNASSSGRKGRHAPLS